MTNKLKEAMKNVEAIEEAEDRSGEPAPTQYLPPGSADQAEYAVEMAGAAAVEEALSGPTFIQTEFTDWRKERLRQDEAELLAQVADIDDQIAVLNARRDNAMLAVSGITADLMAMDK